MTGTTTGGGARAAQKINNTMIVCATVLGLAVLASVVFLIDTGRGTEELIKFINAAVGTIGALTGAGAFIYAKRGAVHSEQAAEQTDGVLEARMSRIVAQELDRRQLGTPPPPPRRPGQTPRYP